MDDAIIANAVFTQIQIGEMRQRLQVLQSHMGDIGTGKVQGLESAQLGNFFQSQIPHARGREGQALQGMQLGNTGEGIIAQLCDIEN